jgi:membrane fusion protein, heavy metal efflux system
MNTKHKLNTLVALLIFSVILLSCGSKAAEEVAEEHHDEEENTVELSDAQYKTAGIEMSKVEQKQISGAIKVNGMLDVPPQQLVSVSVPLGGFLKNTELLQGSRVKKGQVIATIENLDFIQLQQDYLEAKGEFEFSKADYDRQQELAKENVNAQKTLQQAKVTFTSAQARQNGLKEKLKMLNINLTSLEAGNITSLVNIYAPISGYVTEVNANIGKFVNSNDVLFEIVDTEHLHAELTVFEKDIPKIKIGQKVRFTLANETVERTAKVFLVGREISADRTIRIHCHIDKEDINLLPGMYLKAVVENGGAIVNALPDQAVINFQGRKYIFVASEEESDHHEEGKKEEEHQHKEGEKEEEHGHAEEGGHHFMMLEVQTGSSELGYTEIILPENTEAAKLQVVTKGAYDLLSKMKNSEEEGGHAH